MLNIKYNSPTPIYEQLILEVERMVAIKELKPGNEMPSIRSLAAQLDVSNNTVARAYMELERMGIVTSNGRKGTFICDNENIKRNEKMDKIFKESILILLKKGFDESEIRNLFNRNMYEIFN